MLYLWDLTTSCVRTENTVFILFRDRDLCTSICGDLILRKMMRARRVLIMFFSCFVRRVYVRGMYVYASSVS